MVRLNQWRNICIHLVQSNLRPHLDAAVRYNNADTCAALRCDVAGTRAVLSSDRCDQTWPPSDPITYLPRHYLFVLLLLKRLFWWKRDLGTDNAGYIWNFLRIKFYIDNVLSVSVINYYVCTYIYLREASAHAFGCRVSKQSLPATKQIN